MQIDLIPKHGLVIQIFKPRPTSRKPSILRGRVLVVMRWYKRLAASTWRPSLFQWAHMILPSVSDPFKASCSFCLYLWTLLGVLLIGLFCTYTTLLLLKSLLTISLCSQHLSLWSCDISIYSVLEHKYVLVEFLSFSVSSLLFCRVQWPEMDQVHHEFIRFLTWQLINFHRSIVAALFVIDTIHSAVQV